MGVSLRGIVNYTIDLMAIDTCVESKSFKFDDGDSKELFSDASCARCCLHTKLLWGEHFTCAR